MITQGQELEILQRLLGKQHIERLTADKLAGKAHWRWNRGEHLEAAVLFDAAARKSAEEIQQVRPARDNTFNYRVRAGVTFRLAGEHERAWPILMEATTFDWNAAGIPEDSHFTEWAFVEMLYVVAERNDAAGFSKLFRQATIRGAELNFPFPSIHPKQELLLELCSNLGLAKEFAQVVSRIEEQRGKVPARLAKRIGDLMSAISEHRP